jgi:hypothetical protein
VPCYLELSFKLYANPGRIGIEFVGVSDRRPVNLCFHVWFRWCAKKDTRVHIGSGGMSLHPVQATCVLALACSRGDKWRREGKGSQVFGGEVSVRVRECLCLLRGPPLPFYRLRGGVRYTREREREISSRKRRVPEIPLVPFPMRGPRWPFT